MNQLTKIVNKKTEKNEREGKENNTKNLPIDLDVKIRQMY